MQAVDNGAPGCRNRNSFEESQQGMQGCQGVWRAAWDEQVDRQQAVDWADYFRASVKWSAGDGATATGNDNLGFWHGFIGGQQSRLHISGHRASDVDSVSMARGSDKINSKTGEVKKRGRQDVSVGFAGIAAPS